eukprot:TRINITY_DN47383_c0_g2_i1.p1 TRINITY_DN47383_c0_g2~~TRINITY_DN47383_c0_g2_i1.p1  ORF type:complete len:197 (-),score=1.01 TRINITY_DN47383_c0_g2_i1:4-594(-)
MEMERNVDTSQPIEQKVAYDEQCFCIPFCMFHQFKGKFYTVNVPNGLPAGSPFIVEIPENVTPKFVRCIAPDLNDTREPNQCMECERGGGVGKIILEHVPKRDDNNGPFVVQALRTKKDPIWNGFKFCLPLPFLAIFYFKFYATSGGWCEDMIDLKLTQNVEPTNFGGLPLVKAEYWNRHNTGSGGDNFHHHGGPM